MGTQLLIFAVSLFLIVQGATMATTYAAQFAKSLRLSKYTVGFIVIAIISILPETIISLDASLKGIPAFGLGMLLGSNVADLTLVFALIVLLAGRSLKVESKILKNNLLYPFMLLLPVLLGLDGYFSRLEGIALVVVGVLFYYISIKREQHRGSETQPAPDKYKNLALLIISLAVLLLGSHFTVSSASAIAATWGVSPVLIGILVVSLGTTMPEFFFSLKSVRRNDDSLAIGDILGTVLADATIVLGLLALVNPFAFSRATIYIGGVFMVAAALMLFSFMKSGKIFTRKEAFVLFIFWVTFVVIEFIVSAQAL